MTQNLLEKHQALVLDMANMYLNNMALQLGIKYRDTSYRINPHLSDSQRVELRAKHKISGTEFSELYNEFEKMEPTEHMTRAMEAFTASGGNVDIEPRYDDHTNRLDVEVRFSIKDRTLERIEGLSPLEDTILKLNAMLQVDAVLTNQDPNTRPSF